jgi:hypothetical protein
MIRCVLASGEILYIHYFAMYSGSLLSPAKCDHAMWSHVPIAQATASLVNQLLFKG